MTEKIRVTVQIDVSSYEEALAVLVYICDHNNIWSIRYEEEDE